MPTRCSPRPRAPKSATSFSPTPTSTIRARRERLVAATGAMTVGAGPHRPARPLHVGEVNRLDASADMRFVPDLTVADGAMVAGDGWTIEAIATPGHTANHLAYALGGNGLVFSGDHVMGWATTIVAPPDGAMADYMRSLDRLLARPEEHYLPGHGGPIAAAHAYRPRPQRPSADARDRDPGAPWPRRPDHRRPGRRDLSRHAGRAPRRRRPLRPCPPRGPGRARARRHRRPRRASTAPTAQPDGSA